MSRFGVTHNLRLWLVREKPLSSNCNSGDIRLVNKTLIVNINCTFGLVCPPYPQKYKMYRFLGLKLHGQCFEIEPSTELENLTDLIDDLIESDDARYRIYDYGLANHEYVTTTTENDWLIKYKFKSIVSRTIITALGEIQLLGLRIKSNRNQLDIRFTTNRIDFYMISAYKSQEYYTSNVQGIDLHHVRHFKSDYINIPVTDKNIYNACIEQLYKLCHI